MPTPGSLYPSRSGRRPPDRLWFQQAERTSSPMLNAGCPIFAQSHSAKGPVVGELSFPRADLRPVHSTSQPYLETRMAI